MKNRIQILLIAVLITFSVVSSFGQILGGNSQKPEKKTKTFEHIGCGFRFPYPGKLTLSTSISYSPYKEFGDGKINRFTSNLATSDIGCIELDDPPRKMKKDELIASLNSMTKSYLSDSSDFISLPSTIAGGREIYEFKTKTDTLRRIKYILEGNRVLIFLASASSIRGIEESLKIFNLVEHFSVGETVEKRMKMATQKSLPQSPTIELKQTDAAHNNLKGLVKSVRVEAVDVPILVGKAERRIRSDEIYDRFGNLLKDFWFQDAGYPTSVTIYGFVDGNRVSDSEDIDYDTTFRISVVEQGNVKSFPSDPKYKDRYEYKYDDSKRIIERKRYDNQDELRAIYKITYENDLMEEKRLDASGKLISTQRRNFDSDGNEIKYEFWWYENTDKEVETYEYKKFDAAGNWAERRVVKTIINRGLMRTKTSNEFRKIIYYSK
ncbi:MAG TPA: hypothetical protein PKE69_08060 [Pyrinomonadaceae bacterium]|nr:hypothetical protein [Pyrinomonadaceae bacterium]